MTEPLVISDIATLGRARYARDLDEVTIVTRKLKFRNLLPCALKYALWAVRPGGHILVEDSDGENSAPPAFTVSRNLVRQWIARFIGRDVEWIGTDAQGRIALKRVRPIMKPGWSAGIVFSGSDGEIPTLLNCLTGLNAQPELASGNGEILVCGPRRNLDFLAAHPNVRYVEFLSPEGERFMIGRKKNLLMDRMTGPRLVVLHARVVLEAGALAGVPREFDMSSPNTTVQENYGRETYLSLSATDGVWPAMAARRGTLMMRHLKPGADPLILHQRGGLFVDGGAFYVTKELAQECPLHDQIAWNEAEDVEWCGRAFTQGFLIDMAPDSPAYSQTNKLPPRPHLGGLTEFIWSGVRRKSEINAALRDRFERMTGRR
ncbi:hypothetical protein JQ582_39145 [Bradyrhizobium japonicum]|uniref:hypothetical protein n=1 Tax=Bradyrhizobium japonicum TaxID=375 RepID=UPI001BA84546|nr:hypothetical protein [Bradyrhizobium japonicum]MBR0749944.1 hypothetical protein [Bradyrhizobium japonicum]